MRSNPMRTVVAVAASMSVLMAAHVRGNQEQPGQQVGSNVVIKTSMGDITVTLDAAKAPRTVENFRRYVRDGFYDGTVFHRVIPNFMIQGGGFTKDMKQKPTRGAVRNEAGNGLKNLRGTIAMARTPVVDSATSQFFINLKDNAFLDQRDTSAGGFGYCVFGKVVGGMEVVDKIAAVKTATRGPYENVPTEPVVIENVVVQDASPAIQPAAGEAPAAE